MTEQIKDTIFFNDKFYYIVNVTNIDNFFDPNLLGYMLHGASSCCWCGYNVKYNFDQNKNLLVNELILSTYSDDVHPINNVEPIILSNINKHNSNLEMFRKKIQCRLAGNILYENLNLPIDYTGYILIAEDFYECSYRHKSDCIQSLYDKDEYVNPIELTFINGKLVSYVEL